jgi:hypothetical protein
MFKVRVFKKKGTKRKACPRLISYIGKTTLLLWLQLLLYTS